MATSGRTRTMDQADADAVRSLERVNMRLDAVSGQRLEWADAAQTIFQCIAWLGAALWSVLAMVRAQRKDIQALKSHLKALEGRPE